MDLLPPTPDGDQKPSEPALPPTRPIPEVLNGVAPGSSRPPFAVGSAGVAGRQSVPAEVEVDRFRRRLRAFVTWLAALCTFFLALHVFYALKGISPLADGRVWDSVVRTAVRSLGFASLAVFLARRPRGRRTLIACQWAALLLMAEGLGEMHLAKFWDNDGVPIAGLIEHQGIFAGFGFSFTWVCGLILYGVLIPNEWDRLALQSAFLCAVPLALTTYAAESDPDLKARMSLPFIAVVAVMPVFAASLLVYACHAENRLRRDLREASQVGPYRLGAKLGEGGMGVVYMARHRLMKRPCVVKLIRSEAARNPSYLARFEREARALTALAHPNIVEIYDYGRTAEGECYLVMELLDGLTLDALVRRHGPLPPGRAVHVLRQAASALALAHERGLVHRDIKPANLFLCGAGGSCDLVKVLDFGVVQDDGQLLGVDAVTRTGVVLGTPGFIAPEQITGVPVDARVDVYSLGCVALYLLSGRPPFSARTPAGVATPRVLPQPPSESELRGVPADLAAVVARCLRRAPAERFGSAGEVRSALGGCAVAPWTSEDAARWWRDHAEGGKRAESGRSTLRDRL